MSGHPLAKHLAIWFIGLLLALAACTNVAQEVTPVAVGNTPAPSVTSSATPTLTAVPTATNTPTPTNTATPTATPTATALPLNVSGNLRSLQVSEPVPSGLAACGVVDLFDFPIDPPDATAVSRGGGDFGIFRDRYDKFHAGEDWSGPAGRPNLGTPVYSIGHGLVTYAQPLGWGRDQGVVIVQHTFADGRTVLSFYGHLDPDSVVLEPGSCVRRGQQVGQIGQPRGFAHLHFEVRTQAPYQTLTGYWPEDPTTQGWLWPSQQIWAARVAAIPGVAWARPFTDHDTQPIGPLSETSHLILAGKQLHRLNMASGSSNPIAFGRESIDAAVYQPESQLLVLADRTSDILAAYSWPDLIQQWEIDLQFTNVPSLLPLPGGGVLILSRSSMTAVSAEGNELWTESLRSRLLAWQTIGDTVYVTTDGNNGRLWRVQSEGAAVIAELSGKIALRAGGLWLYQRQALYQIDLAGEEPLITLSYILPTGTISRGDLLALPDGTVLLAHAEIGERRLLQFSADGRLLWERSYRAEISGDVTLHLINGQPHLAVSDTSGAYTLYVLNQAQSNLTRLFAGGSRTPARNESWLTAVADNQFLINVGGGPLALFQPVNEGQ